MQSIIKRPALAIAGISALASLWFLYSRLAFAPVPWPDASAFYLPGVDLWSWPPLWRMHAQAAFVPSYDIANFNTMPLLPMILGLAERIGLSTVLGASVMTRAVSLSALVAWTVILFQWIRLETKNVRVASVIALAGLFDPVLRWGTLVVRTETWIGAVWIWLLWDYARAIASGQREFSGKMAWRTGAALAVAAYFHFEAIILVPATLLLVLPWGWKNLFKVGLATLAFLSPWILYGLSHWTLFWEQMHTQFFRLAGANVFIQTFYSIFHSFFISHGSPVSWPKFFNLGKAVFWTLTLGLLGFSIFRLKKLLAPKNDLRWAGVYWGSFVAFSASCYLWFTKPEVWFTTLCHLTIWPWVGAAVVWMMRTQRPSIARGLIFLTGAYGLISLAATTVQQFQIPRQYSWKTYQRWIDCIDEAIPQGITRIWQPHVPDALVELGHRELARGQARLDFTRALDFGTQTDLAYALTQKVDVLLFSTQFPVKTAFADEVPVYSGPERAEDRERMKDGVEVPFGPWMLEKIPVDQPDIWEMHICQVGPFWANLAIRSSKAR